MNVPDYKLIFRAVVDILEADDLRRKELIDAVSRRLSVSEEEMLDCSLCGKYSAMRSQIGTVLSDMEKRNLIKRNENGFYTKAEDGAIAIRVEECEEQILELVSLSPRTKKQIRAHLAKTFGILETETKRDDNILFNYASEILKALVSDGIFDYDGAKYSLAPEKSALIKNRAEMLSLKAAFLKRVHARGGEFFEYYFLNLLTRYLTRCGKTVLQSYVTGGSADGGIDGVVKTRDSLGFRENIMIQMKNRNDTVVETDVRGFYGAMCVQQGSRGIFATVSDFHPAAKALLDSIDNCVGVNGDKIFSMATDVSYGIKRENEKFKIDTELI